VLLVYLDNSLNIQALLVCPAMSGPASLSVTVLSCNFSQSPVGKAAKFRSLYDIGESNLVPASGL